ncbi:MAG: hypothetical protein K2Y32_14340 [Candidatus Obscuribacterales bacterium]|jgi:hypothetical protein|nr:hypothetical protein [Candidatus Obscuribacterales bacterium]
MIPLDAKLAPSFADPANPHAHVTRLKKRVESIGKQLHRLTPTMSKCEDQAAREVADLAYSNWLTARGLTEAADSLLNRRAVDLLLGGNSVEIEIVKASFQDVRALASLQNRIKSNAEAPRENEVILGGKERFGCIAPDPESWFRKDSKQGAADCSSDCALPSVTVVLNIDFNNRNDSVQELLKLADAAIAEAERELGETRARLCHSEDGGSCQLY